MHKLIQKYNVQGPRYTSYPTVPFWKNPELNETKWLESIERNQNSFLSNELSLYVHLPFCESLCTFCGCHKRITKNHSVEKPYIDSVIREWELYKQNLNADNKIKELHFGGGTPTFFRAEELERLLQNIFGASKVDPNEVELSFEAHPNNTSLAHLQTLYDFGFRRLSLGIQDYSPTVQKAINRIQSFEQVRKVHETAKNLGYNSISHDLVFGLPKQTLEDIIDSMKKTLELRPDRISLYSYAHVPWIKGNGQRGYEEKDLPQSHVKRSLYETAKAMLMNAGYLEIGMDHFALPHDSLSEAFMTKTLHRNFMGYTTQKTNLLIGLGMSAISDSWFGFAQNEKSVEAYQERINNNEIPVVRGHILNEIDLEIRQHILDLMCHFETELNPDSESAYLHSEIKDKLSPMIEDGLVIVKDDIVKITLKGTPFVRNCCMAFDQSLKVDLKEPIFSKTI